MIFVALVFGVLCGVGGFISMLSEYGWGTRILVVGVVVCPPLALLWLGSRWLAGGVRWLVSA